MASLNLRSSLGPVDVGRPDSFRHPVSVHRRRAETPREEVRILVAVCPPALGAGLAGWLAHARPGWTVCGVASSRKELRRRLALDFAVAIASVGRRGVLLSGEIATLGLSMPLLAMTDQPDAITEAEILRAGAACVLPLETDREQLIDTLAAVIRGRPPTSVAALRLLAQSSTPGGGLTARQHAILDLIAKGLSNQQIAEELLLSTSTVKTHVSRLVSRFELSGRTDLERRAASLIQVCGPTEQRAAGGLLESVHLDPQQRSDEMSVLSPGRQRFVRKSTGADRVAPYGESAKFCRRQRAGRSELRRSWGRPETGGAVTTSSRRRRWALGAALGVATLAAGAGAALADTGPVYVSISSSGGYVACQTGIPAAEETAISRAIQGTRHPYRHAIYTSGGTVIAVSGQISNDLFDYLIDGASNMSVHRIDNQAAVSGNGLYECQTDAP